VVSGVSFGDCCLHRGESSALVERRLDSRHCYAHVGPQEVHARRFLQHDFPRAPVPAALAATVPHVPCNTMKVCPDIHHRRKSRLRQEGPSRGSRSRASARSRAWIPLSLRRLMTTYFHFVLTNEAPQTEMIDCFHKFEVDQLHKVTRKCGQLGKFWSVSIWVFFSKRSLSTHCIMCPLQLLV
jgi:hypothetical protein